MALGRAEGCYLLEKYYSTVEYTDRYGKVNRQFELYCESGKKPTIGDFLEAFRKAGLEMDITDFREMIFRPKHPATSEVISIRVMRTFRCYEYNMA